MGGDGHALGTCERRRPADFELVVPALNEEGRIGETIAALSEHLATRPWRSHILVVDNGSVDGTTEVVDVHRGRTPIDVIGCRVRGKGAAVRCGMAHTSARWVGYCDADLATPAVAIDAGIWLLQRGVQVVVGSRKCEGAEYASPPSLGRRAASQLFHLMARQIVTGISDTQCGFKLFDGSAGRRLFASTRASGFAFDVEILALARREGMSIAELPVSWSDRKGSTFRMVNDGLRSFYDLRNIARFPPPEDLGDVAG
jgi:dolichyl-phosphate beta-glucosyltransferase